jgi:hypothetical protein
MLAGKGGEILIASKFNLTRIHRQKNDVRMKYEAERILLILSTHCNGSGMMR